MTAHRPKSQRAVIPREEHECTTLIDWAHWRVWNGVRVSQLLVMIPNGQHLAGSAKARGWAMERLKRQGFRVGASDYFLAVPCPALKLSGMWIEMKRTKFSHTSDEQIDFQMLMQERGYRCVVCKGFLEAQTQIERYLDAAGGTVKLLGNAKPKAQAAPRDVPKASGIDP